MSGQTDGQMRGRREEKGAPSGGPAEARLSLSATTHAELRGVAERLLRRRLRAEDSVDAGGLVDEAWLRLAPRSRQEWSSRSHFLACAAKAMRDALVDHARRRRALKRGGDRGRVCLSCIQLGESEEPLDVIALDEALQELHERDPRAASVVELRFFGNLKVAEVAEHLGVSTSTVEAEWRHARAWLRVRLEGGSR